MKKELKTRMKLRRLGLEYEHLKKIAEIREETLKAQIKTIKQLELFKDAISDSKTNS
jgi:hypothetical protein